MPRSKRNKHLQGLLIAVAAVHLHAQTGAADGAAATASEAKAARPAAELSDDELAAEVANSLGPTGIVPSYRGYNASLISSSQHDSISGWSNVLTPSVAYRFSRMFSADVSTPIFLDLHTASTVASATAPGQPRTELTTVTQNQHGIVGDTVLAGHAYLPTLRVAPRHTLYDAVTALLIAPTGSVADGVGAGKTTFNVTNHLEAAARWSPYMDLGIGTSSRVQNRRLQRDQTSRGYLANFALGVRVALPKRTVFAVEAYEQLPLGAQQVSSSEVRQGGPPQTTQATATAGVAEDNGFNTALDVPLSPHVTLSGFYSRSLRQHEDIAGFSLTFLLKGARPR